jgi:hypothetical protein
MFPRLLRRLRRAACIIAVVVVTVSLIEGCISKSSSLPEDSACNDFGVLTLVPGVVCIQDAPTLSPDGKTWFYPATNTQAAHLQKGQILVVARESVRRIEQVQIKNGDVILTTAQVPLTEVVENGTIPLAKSITPGSKGLVSVKSALDPTPPPESAQAPASPSSSVSPSSGPSSASPTVAALVTAASVSTVRSVYKGGCSTATPDQEPEFKATISVSDGPVTVHYHWLLTDSQGQATPVPGTLPFAGTGPQTQTVDYSVPLGQYPPDAVVRGQISLQVDSPALASGAPTPQQLPYQFACTGVAASPSSDGSSGTPVVALAGDQQAQLLAQTDIVVNGYTVKPSLNLNSKSFGIDVSASRYYSSVKLTWEAHGELDGFLTGGAIHIVNQQLQDSSIDATGLQGQLRFDWTLSAAPPASVRNRLSLDLPVRLFIEPMLAGDFPVFLGVDINLHAGIDFTPGQALHGYASVSFGGRQRLDIHAGAPNNTTGLSLHGLGLDSGIRRLVGMPTLDAYVEFPYLTLGDDLYSQGAWLWVSPRLEISIAAGRSPNVCALATTDGSATAGLEFQILGLHVGVSHPLFHEPVIPAESFPRSPPCPGS